jgi:hypothetical protein
LDRMRLLSIVSTAAEAPDYVGLWQGNCVFSQNCVFCQNPISRSLATLSYRMGYSIQPYQKQKHDCVG